MTANGFMTQRPHKATHSEMAEFHRDDYIDYLSKITPGNENEFGALMQKCEITFVTMHRRPR